MRLLFATYGMMIWYRVGGSMITLTIRAILVPNFFGKMTMKKLSGFGRSWLVLELTMRERKISSTNASIAIR